MKYKKVLFQRFIFTSMVFFAFTAISFAQISGTVKDTGGEPLVGVSVIQKGTTKGVVTDANGIFNMNVEPGTQLKFSSIGYTDIELEAQSEMTVTMEEGAQNIDDVVVVGFGQQRKVNLTGSVSVVKSDAFESRPVQNVGQALQGMVPGLNLTVNNSGGELNNTLDLSIRGGGTLGKGSKAGVLVLIDGMEGNMNALNPQDIESISILKDAAASSIYGSRAPFGVLLITTKKGKAGKVTVNYNNNFRWSDPLLMPKMLNSENFAEYWNLAAKESGEGAPFSEYTLQKIRDFRAGLITDQTEANTTGDSWKNYTNSWGDNDWFDVQYKNWAFSQEHNLSVNGGTEKVQYFISGNLLDQNGLLTFSKDKYGRYTISPKVTAQIFPWLKIGSSTKFIRETYDRSAYQTALFYHNIARRWPTLPLTYPKKEGVPFDNPNYGDCNEIEQLRSGGRDKTEKDFIYQQIQLEIEPIKNWKIFADGNFRQTTNFQQWEILPIYMMQPSGKIDFVDFDGGGSDYTPGLTRVYGYGWKENYYNANVYTDYSHLFDSGHYFKVMVGFQSELTKTRDLSARGDGLITVNTPTVSNTTVDPRSSGTFDHWATLGFFGRVNYNYKERYLFEASLRYDGSSRFLRDQRWQWFPSFSVGWNIANEEFMSDIKWIKVLKPRASWGQLGNQNTENWYPFYTTIPIKKDHSWLLNGQKPSIYVEKTPELVSTLLTWETVEDWNAALDFELFNSRLTGTFEVYQRRTLNMVGPAPSLPEILGVNVPNINNADLLSQGWDLEIGWRDYVSSIGLSYGVRFNIADNTRKVTRYPNPTNKVSDDDWYAGKLSGEIWGYTTLGIAQTQAEMDAHLATLNNGGQNALGTNWQAGDIMYKDINGDGKIDGGQGVLGNMGDKKIIGNSTPRYTYGFNGDIAWKGFDLQIFIQGVGKRDYWVSGAYFWGADGGMWQSAGFENHLDFWRPANAQSIDKNAPNYNYFGANPSGYLPRPDWGSGKNKEKQTRYLQNAAYLRLKNIQLGYTLPASITQKFGCNKLRIYISGDNLLTFTDLVSTFDPETISGGWGDGKVYPLSKVISGGLSITF